MTLLATIAVFVAGAWLLLSGDARAYQGLGAVLMIVAVAGLLVSALISRARRRSGAAVARRGGSAGVRR